MARGGARGTLGAAGRRGGLAAGRASMSVRACDIAPKKCRGSVLIPARGRNKNTAILIGGGQPVAAALAATNASVPLELRLDVPKDAPIGTTNLTVAARGATSNATLPIEVRLATDLPAKLTLNPQLPELRGTSKS